MFFCKFANYLQCQKKISLRQTLVAGGKWRVCRFWVIPADAIIFIIVGQVGQVRRVGQVGRVGRGSPIPFFRGVL